MSDKFGRTMRALFVMLLASGLSWTPLAQGAQDDAAAEEETPEVETAFEALYGKFNSLRTYFQTRNGMSDRDEPTVLRVRDEITAFNQQWPDYPRSLAIEVQLSMWVKDTERVDAVFAHLSTLLPGNKSLIVGWAEYHIGESDYDRAIELLSDHRDDAGAKRVLIDCYLETGRYDEAAADIAGDESESAARKLTFATTFKERSFYAGALRILDSFEPDDRIRLQYSILKAECQSGDEAFSDARVTLELIPPELLEGNESLLTEVNKLKDEYLAQVKSWDEERAFRSRDAQGEALPQVALETSRGRIVIELFENDAPNTVANFLTLVEADFYDGTQFDYYLRNFVMHFGDPRTRADDTDADDADDTDADADASDDVTDHPGYSIPDEHGAKSTNKRRHFAGTVAMSNRRVVNSAGSQFFITMRPESSLDDKFTVFGRVIEGMELVRQLQREDVLEQAVVLNKREHEYAFEQVEHEDSRLTLGPSTRP